MKFVKIAFMSNLNILFLSNGFGEDAVSAGLINEFRKRKGNYSFSALPLVGRGKQFEVFDINLAGPRSEMPSGGLVNNNIMALLKDFYSGLIRLTIEQIKFLRDGNKKFDFIVCVGDRYPLILASFFTGLPIAFVGVAQSVRLYGYSFFERYLLKTRAKMIFTRDEDTAHNLQKYEINAKFLGNPMMDTFSLEGPSLDFSDSSGVIGILPGSRKEVNYNLKISLKVCSILYLASPSLVFLVALSPNVSKNELFQSISDAGWSFREEKDFIILKHIDGAEVMLSQNYFGWIIKHSQVLLGLSGTGNEQAAGLGKPVVTFWSPERQVRPAFMKHQKSLLGDSLIIVSSEPEIISKKLLDILNDPVMREKYGNEGVKMMGGRGGISKIVDSLEEFGEKFVISSGRRNQTKKEE